MQQPKGTRTGTRVIGAHRVRLGERRYPRFASDLYGRAGSFRRRCICRDVADLAGGIVGVADDLIGPVQPKKLGSAFRTARLEALSDFVCRSNFHARGVAVLVPAPRG